MKEIYLKYLKDFRPTEFLLISDVRLLSSEIAKFEMVMKLL